MSDPVVADVVIVGSGIAGALTAYTLARSGVKVLILEAGPRVDRQKALAHFRASATKSPNSPYPAHPKVPQPDSDAIGAYYVQAGPETFNTLQARVVGGTTWHWGGLALRYHPSDFALRTRYGVGVDWPLAYTDVEPWYVEAENAIGVAGPADEDWDAPRSQGYPMPMVAPTYLDQVVAAACKTIGMKMTPVMKALKTINRETRPPS
jgi:choline dehydrogenase-like flavoprotein